jgi:hypothetical protein
MIIFLGLVIVSAVLTLSATIVLFGLASEAEVLPSLTRAGDSDSDEPAASPGDYRSGLDVPARSRSRVPLSH